MRHARRGLIAVLAVAAVLVAAGTSQAFLRRRYSDEQVVATSELIVVATMRPEPVAPIVTMTARGHGIYVNHRVVLDVHETLKGAPPPAGGLPILIHHGLTPCVGGRHDCPCGTISARGVSSTTIQVYDAASAEYPLSARASEPNIWFLRRSRGPFESMPLSEELGIVEPCHLRELRYRAYFLALLSSDPKAAVAELRRSGGAAPDEDAPAATTPSAGTR